MQENKTQALTPKVNRPMMLAYTTPDGHLTESDPMQGVLKFTPGQASSI